MPARPVRHSRLPRSASMLENKPRTLSLEPRDNSAAQQAVGPFCLGVFSSLTEDADIARVSAPPRDGTDGRQRTLLCWPGASRGSRRCSPEDNGQYRRCVSRRGGVRSPWCRTGCRRPPSRVIALMWRRFSAREVPPLVLSPASFRPVSGNATDALALRRAAGDSGRIVTWPQVDPGWPVNNDMLLGARQVPDVVRCRRCRDAARRLLCAPLCPRPGNHRFAQP